jgi:uncharacterized protein YndB with AHSA1/START domain
MNQNKTRSKDTQNQELFITRIFDAPRERVWKAWTEPELMKRWWGPKAYTSPYCKIDLRHRHRRHERQQQRNNIRQKQKI